ncbi:50S ribosomal protein L23 [Pontibacter sp. G13]|uniref:50S ribosomal protein L23 n=1 Tax=Pontibacter sp. G13 TaxID=3074898 RepID=UPI002889CB7F|nr:50S ribosomal protein L23 [Pontibacter sp. G13]WNJ16519.1 50S ribosomal protein L23 [Pontibacter sp. G13]
MSILKRPIITEKSSGFLEAGQPRYGFEVDIKATKADIKAEVERVYEVAVKDVNTMIVRGKTKARYTKRGVVRGKASNYKKAIVTLKEGHEIDFYKHI